MSNNKMITLVNYDLFSNLTKTCSIHTFLLISFFFFCKFSFNIIYSFNNFTKEMFPLTICKIIGGGGDIEVF